MCWRSTVDVFCSAGPSGMEWGDQLWLVWDWDAPQACPGRLQHPTTRKDNWRFSGLHCIFPLWPQQALCSVCQLPHSHQHVQTHPTVHWEEEEKRKGGTVSYVWQDVLFLLGKCPKFAQENTNKVTTVLSVQGKLNLSSAAIPHLTSGSYTVDVLWLHCLVGNTPILAGCFPSFAIYQELSLWIWITLPLPQPLCVARSVSSARPSTKKPHLNTRKRMLGK